MRHCDKPLKGPAPDYQVKENPMKSAMFALTLILLAGCTVVPVVPYYTYGPYYQASYYTETATDNDYYSSGYNTPRYSGYYETPCPGCYGHVYYYPSRTYTYTTYSYAAAPAYRASPQAKQTHAALRSIYFDLNESEIRFEAAKTLRRNLEWFRQHPGKRVSIVGNCDPRATGQYNLALGQRRAEATKRQLVALGVDAARLETISYGESRPTCREQDESCWARERRVDFMPAP